MVTKGKERRSSVKETDQRKLLVMLLVAASPMQIGRLLLAMRAPEDSKDGAVYM